MNDGSKIIITAGLKVSDTVEQIKQDLKSVEAQLNQNVSLDLIAGIRVDKKSIEKATKEINSIGTNDTGKAVINTFDKIGDAAERNAKRIKVISKSLANVGTEYLQQIPYIDNNGLKKNNNVLLGDLKKQLSPLGSNVSVKGIAGENANGFDYITATVKNAAGEMRTFTFAVDEAEQSYKYLSSTFNDKGIERVNKEVLKLTKQFAEFKSSHRAIQSGLTEPMKEFENVLEKINNGNGSVEELQKAYNNLAITASNIGINLGTKNKGFNIFDNAVNDSKSFETRLKKIKNEIYSFSDDYDKQRNELLRRTKEIEYQVATSSDGVYDEEWSKEYNKISESLKILETDLKNVKTEEKEYLKLLKEEQDQNAKNKKYIQDTQHEYWQGRFVDSIQDITAGNSELELLKEQLLADDKAAKEFANTYTKLQRQINGRINTLDTQYNSVPFKNNTSNADVVKQRNSIEQTVNSYRLLLNELNSTTEPKALIDIIEKIQKIEPEFIKVSSANKTLQNELRSSNSLETFNNRIEKLKATMSSYAAENERAVNSTKLMPNGRSFMQEWNLMSNALKKDITPDDLKHLTERMAIFGKTAQAAGLSGETAWQKFLNTFKTFSTYISADMIFGYIRRTVTDMVQEVISMDSAMTELRKVTEATEQQFYKLSETAAKTGKELGASITDIINATSVFSRAGYGLEDAEKLGFTSDFVPQSEATPEIDSAVLDRVALEERIKTDCPYPLHMACPRSARYAYLDDDEIVIVFHAFNNTC